MMNAQRSVSPTPDETTPQKNAHIGGNHVMGLSSSSTSRAAGGGEDCGTAGLTMSGGYA